MKTKTYLIGMSTEKRQRLRAIGEQIRLGLIISVAFIASFAVGYLVGLTRFYGWW